MEISPNIDLLYILCDPHEEGSDFYEFLSAFVPIHLQNLRHEHFCQLPDRLVPLFLGYLLHPLVDLIEQIRVLSDEFVLSHRRRLRPKVRRLIRDDIIVRLNAHVFLGPLFAQRLRSAAEGSFAADGRLVHLGQGRVVEGGIEVETPLEDADWRRDVATVGFDRHRSGFAREVDLEARVGLSRDRTQEKIVVTK